MNPTPFTKSTSESVFHYAFLDGLKLTVYTWVGLKSGEINLPLLLRAGIKGVNLL